MESKETIEPDLLQQVAAVLKVPVEAIKNFSEEAAMNVISNTFTSHDTSTLNAINYYPTFNPIDKIIELYKEKEELYERMLKEKAELIDKLLNATIENK